jgi:hypothetical protein
MHCSGWPLVWMRCIQKGLGCWEQGFVSMIYAFIDVDGFPTQGYCNVQFQENRIEVGSPSFGSGCDILIGIRLVERATFPKTVRPIIDNISSTNDRHTLYHGEGSTKFRVCVAFNRAGPLQIGPRPRNEVLHHLYSTSEPLRGQ